jgi:hypothetical protein
MMMHTTAEHLVRGLAALVLMAGISGCAWVGIGGGKDPMPRDVGLYAAHEGRLQRLDGNREWEMKTWPERSNLSPEIEFVIRHPQLQAAGDRLEEVIHLRRVAWVRSEISQEGDILPVDGNQWAVAEIDELRVPFRLERHGSNNEVVRVIPEQRLERGLYNLQFRSAAAQLNARIGVNWDAVDRRAYSAANCVDRYPGDAVRYRPCAEQEHALASKWLRVHLVDPEMREVSGQQKLIVKGVVVNTSQRSRRVPVLEAQLRSAQGEVIKRWQFDAAAAELEPGASARFRSELPNPPPGARNIHVTFASTAAGRTGRASP